MSVRFDASGEHYTRNLAISVVANWSLTCWARLASDRATTTVLWQIDNGSATSRLRVNVWNGTALTVQTDSGGWFVTLGQTMTVGTWYFIGISATSTGSLRVRVRAAGSNTWVGSSSSQADLLVGISATSLRLGAGNEAGSWLDGSLAAVKAWSLSMSMDELEAESWSYLPRRANAMRLWYPLLTPDTADYSGAAQTLSGGTGAVADDGPPLTWSSHRTPIVLSTAAPSISGTMAATLPSLTASMSGTVKASGTLAATLPPLAAAAAANAKAAGTLAATLPPLTATLTGALGQAGALTATLPALTAQFVGQWRGGFLTPTLPALTASLTGAARTTGTLTATLPALTAQMVGAVVIPPFDLVATAGPPQRAWVARLPATTWACGPPARAWKTCQPTT